ncbi:MAG: RNase adapter RapZ [Rhodospirillaceae bacterium]
MTDQPTAASAPTAPGDHTEDVGATPVLIVTGMSGAGRSSALKALEDLGYEAVDNLPLSLLSSLVMPSTGAGRPLAIGVDVRTRDFGVEPFLEELDELIGHRELAVRLLFLDCNSEVLRRRFTETRRRHPLAPDRPVTDGIAYERRMLAPLQDRADEVIDTSEMSIGALRQRLDANYALDVAPGLAIFVMSFAYRRGIPHEADLVFDVRFLRNPHYDDVLRPMTGMDASVGDFIEGDPDFATYLDNLKTLLEPLLPRYSAEGKSYLTIAVGCTGGRHRSVYVARLLGAWLGEKGERVVVSHRDLNKEQADGMAS